MYTPLKYRRFEGHCVSLSLNGAIMEMKANVLNAAAGNLI